MALPVFIASGATILVQSHSTLRRNIIVNAALEA